MNEESARKYSEDLLPIFGIKTKLNKDTRVYELWDDTEYIVFTVENNKKYILIASDYLKDKDVPYVIGELQKQGYPNVCPLEYKKNKYCYRNDDFGIWCKFMVLEILE